MLPAVCAIFTLALFAYVFYPERNTLAYSETNLGALRLMGYFSAKWDFGIDRFWSRMDGSDSRMAASFFKSTGSNVPCPSCSAVLRTGRTDGSSRNTPLVAPLTSAPP